MPDIKGARKALLTNPNTREHRDMGPDDSDGCFTCRVEHGALPKRNASNEEVRPLDLWVNGASSTLLPGYVGLLTLPEPNLLVVLLLERFLIYIFTLFVWTFFLHADPQRRCHNQS